MCRLFGMVTGARAARATFWLLDAPDSLNAQSRSQPDGTGLGWFDDDGIPWVDKAPLAAWEDATFALEARELVHVDADLSVQSHIALPQPPANRIGLADLHPRAAASQTHV